MEDPRTENRALWDAWSDAFQGLWNADTAEGDLPPAPYPFADAEAAGDRREALLPPVEEMAFVELGCGGGQAAIGAAQEGASNVVGIDFSTEQLRHAKRLREFYDVDVQFAAGDVTNVPLAADAFDVAFSGWVYFMVEDLSAALREARRILRDDGVLVFGVPHPFYELFDPETAELERSYHATGPRHNSIDEAYDAEMVIFDRTVGDLHNALVDAGFVVERIEETPEHDDPAEYEDDPLDSNQPELMAMVPRGLRFWAVAS